MTELSTDSDRATRTAEPDEPAGSSATPWLLALLGVALLLALFIILALIAARAG